MKKFAKVALGALLMAGAATAVASSPAEARVVVGLGFGGPAYYPPPGYYSCDPYSRWYDPYRCGYSYPPSYYYGGYYGPSFAFGFGGGWYGRDYDGWRGRGFRGDRDDRFRGGGFRGGREGGRGGFRSGGGGFRGGHGGGRHR